MTILLTISAYLLDMLIITIFLNNLFDRKESYNPRKYFCALIIVEIVIFFNEWVMKLYPFAYAKPITVALSMITTFLLCFFFEASFRAKILAACIFQVLVSVGETVFTYMVSEINPDFINTGSTDILYNTMNSGSKLVLLACCISIAFFWRKDRGEAQTEYHILLLSTPLITLGIYCILSLKVIYKGDALFYNLLFICLAALNVVNFMLIKKSQTYTVMKFQNAQMEQQIQFQKEKYNQLSEAYRQNRRLIHDVKKHYFSVQKYIEHQDFDSLFTYIRSAVEDLEYTYAKYNTGNLVIDAFLTNYENLFEASHIGFLTRLNVECSRIPVSDYDLCIILGNILDNALRECKRVNLQESKVLVRFLIEIETTDQDKFRIHTENLCPDKSMEVEQPDSLNHGYGLENIKKTVEENKGFVSVQVSDYFIMDILIPIIDESLRIAPVKDRGVSRESISAP